MLKQGTKYALALILLTFIIWIEGSTSTLAGTNFTKTDTTQADFQTGTLSNVTAGTAGGGDLELANNPTLNFDGTSSYVEVGNIGARPTTGTIEFWMKPSVVEDYRNVLCTNGLTGNVGFRFEEHTGGYFEVDIGDDLGNCTGHIFTNTGLQANTWNHIALVWDSSQNKVWGYLNGTLVINGESQTYWATNLSDIKIGVGFNATRYWKGLIDEVRIWNTARAQSDIQSNMNRELVGNETGLMDYWKFDEGTGTTANDSTSSAKNGTINGAVWVANNSNLHFGGVSDYVGIGNLGARPTTGTIEFWMNPDVVENYRNAFCTNGLTGNVGFRFEEHAGGYFEVDIGNDSGTFTSHVFTSSSLQANTWNHVALAWDSSQNKVWGYLNGTLVINGESQTYWATNLSDVRVGVGYDATRYWKGLIDEVRIWNTARAQSDIQSNMNRELVGNETGLMDYWKFDEGTGTVANDSTSSAKNGTINGATWTTNNSWVRSNMNYTTSGSRTSSPINVSSVGYASNSTISWNKTDATTTNATFTRSSVAYQQSGAQVASGVPRYEVGKFGQAVTVEEGTTNLLTANQSHPTSASGFSTNNCTFSIDSTTGWAGSSSGKIVVTSNGQAIVSSMPNTTGLIGNTKYTFSTQLKTNAISTQWQLGIDWFDSSGTYITTTWGNNINVSSAWSLTTFTTTSPSNATQCTVKILLQNGSPGSALWFDGLQLEQKPYATSFITGGTTRAGEIMAVPASGVWNKGNWEVDLIYQPTSVQTVSGSWRTVFVMNLDANNKYHLVIDPSGRPYLAVVSNGVEVNNYSTSDPVMQVGTWYNLSIRGNGSTMALFINGVISAKGNISYTEPLGNVPANAYIGIQPGGATQGNGIYDDLRISSRARTDAEILADYNSNAPLPVDGDTTYKLAFDNNLQASIGPVKVETNLSTDGGTTWGGWQEATSGGAIPGISNGTNLTNGRLQYRTTLSTIDTIVTPQLNDITLSIAANVAPTISINSPTANQTINASGTVTISGTVTDPDSAETITISATINGVTKQTTIAAPASGAAWSLSWTGAELAQGSYTNITFTANDGAGGINSANYTGSITVDKTAPTVTISAPSASVTSTGPITYTVTYTGANTVNLTNANVTLNKTGTANGTVNVTNGTTSTPTVTISSITGDGTLEITIAAGTSSSAGGNFDAGAGPSTTFTVDNTAPTVNAPTATSTQMTSITVQAHATDATAMQYIFNIGGVDQGTWQSSSIYTFTGLTANTSYAIKYKAQDAVGNISGYSAVLNVTTASTQVPAATISEVRNIGNNNSAADIRIIFWGAADETEIASYKIIVASGTIDEATASGLTSTSYFAEPAKGKHRMHLLYLPAALQTSSGGAISQTGGAYNVYVLSVAKTGYANKLSIPVSITLATNNAGAKVEAPVPIVADVANNGNGSDLRVIFRKPKSEVNISAYRIIVSTADLTPSDANNITDNTKYKEVAATDPRGGYVAIMGSTQTDQVGTAIQNGTAYKVYILVIGKNHYANVLSTPSKIITLSQYVPGAFSVRGLRVVNVGSGHDSSNISVTFFEPTVANNVQEYRIFIAPTGNTLSQVTAEGISNTALYQVVAAIRRGAYHTVTLGSEMNDYTNAALSAGDYKVYMLTVGKSGYANRLSGASGTVTLN